jgi:predicted DNA-binding ribbon-helix-helix protein
MRSSGVKCSIVVAGHRTSVSLEDAFRTALKEIAAGRNMTLSDLIAAIDCHCGSCDAREKAVVHSK